MTDRRLLDLALADLADNPEQMLAVQSLGHCVVLAGPGSGKTKTLTTAIARTLLEDVIEPRGIACITYNNECALELESKLALLDVHPSHRVFIGTVHSFALSQVIVPYARCVHADVPPEFRIATSAECQAAVQVAYQRVIGEGGDPKSQWSFAEFKRRSQVDRTRPEWRGRNEELADFVEEYERVLRAQSLIDFDDMPLIACRMISENGWISEALAARFPVLFVDEYQDLGYALHELVLKLCFEANVRLFAVGDPDQSIYNFAGAHPKLLKDLAIREDVLSVPLRLNYRCGTSIMNASLAALGEERSYEPWDSAKTGSVLFKPVQGSLRAQADFVMSSLIPELCDADVHLDEIGVLYRNAEHGDAVAAAAAAAGIPVVRSDKKALIHRNSPLARWIESCACWVADGWKTANPPFHRLVAGAMSLVYGAGSTDAEAKALEHGLIEFLAASREQASSVNAWLRAFKDALLAGWMSVPTAATTDWSVLDELIDRTDPESPEGDMSLAHFAGRTEGSGRLVLSTLHSAKGREFDAVIMFAMNSGVIPNYWETKKPEQMREGRRVFYVGVTRARKFLVLVFEKGKHSPWVKELHDRVTGKQV